MGKPAVAAPDLESKRALRRSRRLYLDIDTLKGEHAAFGSRAARGGKSAYPAARRQHSVARDDQRDRVFCHGLADIACGLRSRAEFLRQRAVGRRVAPPDLPQDIIDLLEEGVLIAKIERVAGKVD